MKDEVKQYIVENIELIDNNEFDELYRHCPKAYTHHLTFALQQAGIYPEKFMTKIPFCFMYGNPMMERFVVPSSVETIENNAFESSHIKTIVFDPNCSVRTLETCCFAHSKVKHIQWPSNLFMINTECFKGCWEIEELKLPDGLFTIADSAFVNCTKLRKVTIPASVGYIGRSAFSYCPELTEVIFERGSNAKLGMTAFGDPEPGTFASCNEHLKITCYEGDPTIDVLKLYGYKVSVVK